VGLSAYLGRRLLRRAQRQAGHGGRVCAVQVCARRRACLTLLLRCRRTHWILSGRRIRCLRAQSGGGGGDQDLINVCTRKEKEGAEGHTRPPTPPP
jgi:hypothetical protein